MESKTINVEEEKSGLVSESMPKGKGAAAAQIYHNI